MAETAILLQKQIKKLLALWSSWFQVSSENLMARVLKITFFNAWKIGAKILTDNLSNLFLKLCVTYEIKMYYV